MAGTIIADTIQATSQQISLNVGNTTILTASSTGLTLIPSNNVNINVTNSNVTLTNANITTANITTANITGVATFSTGSAALPSITTAGDPDTGIYFPSANTIGFTRGGVEVGRFDSNSANANFQFNSGYGSVATAYGCRAWVNFNGTGTVAIRAAGNVTSITDNSTGNYTINFTTALSDTNYVGVFGIDDNGNIAVLCGAPSGTKTTTAFQVRSQVGVATIADSALLMVAIFR
jgi:hypothetical protein